jgi:hypothetical protein
MFARCHFRSFVTAFGLVAAAGVCPGQQPTAAELQGIILDLQEQNQTLQRSLVEANRGEKEAVEQLAQLRLRVKALGKNLLDGGEDRHVQAVADLEIAHERLTELESAVARVTSSITEYMRHAVVSDPDARLRVESSLRELDAVLGLRQKPRPDIRLGTLQQAQVVSLDQDSGMLVFNIGESQGAKIGMTFHLVRGQQPYGQAILADVRKNICGAFVEKLDPPTESPRPGDLAVLVTEQH